MPVRAKDNIDMMWVLDSYPRAIDFPLNFAACRITIDKNNLDAQLITSYKSIVVLFSNNTVYNSYNGSTGMTCAIAEDHRSVGGYYKRIVEVRYEKHEDFGITTESIGVDGERSFRIGGRPMLIDTHEPIIIECKSRLCVLRCYGPRGRDEDEDAIKKIKVRQLCRGLNDYKLCMHHRDWEYNAVDMIEPKDWVRRGGSIHVINRLWDSINWSDTHLPKYYHKMMGADGKGYVCIKCPEYDGRRR